MNKKILEGVFYFAFCGTLTMSFTNAATMLQTETGIFVKTEAIRDKGELPHLIRVELPNFNEHELNSNVVTEVGKAVLDRYGKDIRIAFVLPDSVTTIKGCVDVMGGYRLLSKKARTFSYIEENLEQLIVSPKNRLEFIGCAAFYDCRFLDCIKSEGRAPFLGKQENPFPNLKEIEAYAFSHCQRLTTPPFNENTPLDKMGERAFFGTGISHFTIPKTLSSCDRSFQGCPLRTIFVPKETNLCHFRINDDDRVHNYRFVIDNEVKSEDIPLFLSRLLRNYNYTSNISSPASIILNTSKERALTNPKKSILDYKKYEEDSVILWNHRIIYYDKNMETKIPSHKIYFLSKSSLKELVDTAYTKYIFQKEVADGGYQEFLSCLSPELVLYAFSQNAGKLLETLKADRAKRLFIFKSFVLSRLGAGISCFDLFDACPDLDINPRFIRNCSLQNDFSIPKKCGVSKDFVDLIRRDDLNSFINCIEKEGYSLDKIPGPSGYRLTAFPDHRPENFSPMGLAALFGSINIFKFLISNKVEFPSSIWDFAFYGGHPEIIHILEEQPELEKRLQYSLKHLSEKIPHPRTIEYLENNYEIERNIFNKRRNA